MFTESDFIKWLKHNKKLSDSSIKKYKSSISQASSYLVDKSIIDDLMDDKQRKLFNNNRSQFNLYKLQNTKILRKAIERYFEDQQNKDKDEKGHRQWSAALNNLIEFYDSSLSSGSLNKSFPNVFDHDQLNDSVSKLRKLGIHGSPEGNEKPRYKLAKNKSYERDPKVVAWVLENANGICEGCDKKAPFIKQKDSSAYLEVHHVKRLASSGRDTIDNAVALCPNCHREAHYGEKKNIFTEKLKKIAASHS